MNDTKAAEAWKQRIRRQLAVLESRPIEEKLAETEALLIAAWERNEELEYAANPTGADPEYVQLAQLAYDTVLAVMTANESKHPDAKWKTQSMPTREELRELFKDPDYRHLYVTEMATTIPAIQIKNLRLENDWSQQQLGEAAEMSQGRISQVENPDYGRFNISTLTRLAEAFDCALQVRFLPYSSFLDWVTNFDNDVVAVPSFANDPGLEETTLSASSKYADLILAALQRPRREAALVEALRTIAGKHTMVTATGKYRPWKALAVKLQRIAHEALISPPGLSEG